MKLIDSMLHRVGLTRIRRVDAVIRRSYAMAKQDRLVSQWKSVIGSADSEIAPDLAAIRARSRQFAMDNDYFARYLKLRKANIVGPQSIQLQNQTMLADGMTLDEKVNSAIESAWLKFGERKNFTVERQLDMHEATELFVTTIATDGEVLMLMYPGFDNEFNFALQFIETDQLPNHLNGRANNGNQIRMGIELDRRGRRVAYHILSNHPNDFHYILNNHKMLRIPADQVIHAFQKERIGQTRGVPYIHAGGLRLYLIAGFDEAEINACRISSSTMGILQAPPGAEWMGSEKDDEGREVITLEPGTFPKIPDGWTLNTFDPKHPTGNYETALRVNLRPLAGGLGLSYASLASDLSNVNYGSLRGGSIEERDLWKMEQRHTFANLHQPIYTPWLTLSVGHGVIPLPFSSENLRRYDNARWRTRGWQWVDPLKDTISNLKLVEMRCKSKTMVCDEMGYDYESVLREIARDEALEKQLGLHVAMTPTGLKVTVKEGKGNEDDETDEEDRMFRPAIQVSAG